MGITNGNFLQNRNKLLPIFVLAVCFSYCISHKYCIFWVCVTFSVVYSEEDISHMAQVWYQNM